MKCALVASCLHLLLMLLAATALFHFVSKNTIGVDSTSELHPTSSHYSIRHCAFLNQHSSIDVRTKEVCRNLIEILKQQFDILDKLILGIWTLDYIPDLYFLVLLPIWIVPTINCSFSLAPIFPDFLLLFLHFMILQFHFLGQFAHMLLPGTGLKSSTSICFLMNHTHCSQNFGRGF